VRCTYLLARQGADADLAAACQDCVLAVVVDELFLSTRWCLLAKLLGDNGFEYYIKKYDVVMGRKSKVGGCDS
jgi:hypothetical protein